MNPQIESTISSVNNTCTPAIVNTSRSTFLSRILFCFLACALALFSQTARANEASDGPVLRGISSYTVRAGLVDYTTGGSAGFVGKITITRAGSPFFFSRDIWANRNQFVGVMTWFPNRTYKITCKYRGLTATRYVTALPYNRANFTFKYSYNPFTGRASLGW
jgi:hypothetical protein